MDKKIGYKDWQCKEYTVYVYHEVYISGEAHVCRLINVWFCKNFPDNKITKCALDFSNVSIRSPHFSSKKLFYGVLEIKISSDEGLIKNSFFWSMDYIFSQPLDKWTSSIQYLCSVTSSLFFIKFGT